MSHAYAEATAMSEQRTLPGAARPAARAQRCGGEKCYNYVEHKNPTRSMLPPRLLGLPQPAGPTRLVSEVATRNVELRQEKVLMKHRV